MYRGDFDNFELCWLIWQPYQRFYDRQDYMGDYDFAMMDAVYMALGHVPLVAMEIIEYVMPDRVLR